MVIACRLIMHSALNELISDSHQKPIILLLAIVTAIITLYNKRINFHDSRYKLQMYPFYRYSSRRIPINGIYYRHIILYNIWI